MADDKMMNLVGGFLKALGAELEKSGSAPEAVQEPPVMNFEGPAVFSGESFRGTLVGRETTLVFDNDNPKTDVSLPQLVNILTNASSNAGVAFAKLTEIDLNEFEDRSLRTAMKTARRMTVLLRDSLYETAQLLQGKDLDDEVEDNDLYDEKPSPFGKRSDGPVDEILWRGPKSAMPPPDADPEDRIEVTVADSTNALFLAEIYQDLKIIKGEIIGHGPPPSLSSSRIQDVMNKIQERTEKGHV